VVRDTAADLGGLVAWGGALVLDAGLLDGRGAGGGDGGDIAVIGVDADEGLAVVRLDVLDHHVPLAHGLAVAAGAVQLSEVDNREPVNCHRAKPVVLDDLVICAGGAAVFAVSESSLTSRPTRLVSVYISLYTTWMFSDEIWTLLTRP
jgi:hypothetical protein